MRITISFNRKISAVCVSVTCAPVIRNTSAHAPQALCVFARTHVHRERSRETSDLRLQMKNN